MAKKKNNQSSCCCCCEPCACQPCACKPMNTCGCGCNDGCGCGNNNGFFGLNGCVTPIIFLLIACGSGVLASNKSYLIILLFLLCGGSFTSLFGGGQGCC